MYLEKAFLRHFTSKEDLLLSLKVSQLSKRKSIQLKIQHCLVILCVAFLRSFFLIFSVQKIILKGSRIQLRRSPSHPTSFSQWVPCMTPFLSTANTPKIQQGDTQITSPQYYGIMYYVFSPLFCYVLAFLVLNIKSRVRTRKSSDWRAGIFWPFFSGKNKVKVFSLLCKFCFEVGALRLAQKGLF